MVCQTCRRPGRDCGVKSRDPLLLTVNPALHRPSAPSPLSALQPSTRDHLSPSSNSSRTCHSSHWNLSCFKIPRSRTSTMSAETSDLTKVDSAVSGLSSSPTEKKIGHRRASSSAAGVYNINDLGMETVSTFRLGPADMLHRKGREGTADSKGNSEAELVSDYLVFCASFVHLLYKDAP